MTGATRACLFLSAALALSACTEEAPETAGPAANQGGEPAAPADPVAAEEIDPNDRIGQEMAQRAQQFAEGMTPATPLFRGTLSNGGTQDYQAILQGARCFKIVGVGGQGVTDLDLFLFDPNGVQVQQDTATDSYPVLGLTHPICPETSGSYRVQVKMFQGSGDFGVRVYESGG